MAAPFRGVDGRWYVDVLAGSQVNGPGRYTRAHATPFATPFATPYEQGTHRLCRCVPCSYGVAHMCTLLQGLPYGLLVAVHALPLKA